MKIKVRHHDRKLGLDLFLGDEMGNDLGRHEVGANCDIRLQFGNQANKGPGIQPIEKKPHLVRFPWLITPLIPPPQQSGGILYQSQIKLRIKVAEQLIGERKGIHVHHLPDSGAPPADCFDCRSRPHMARSGTSRKD